MFVKTSITLFNKTAPIIVFFLTPITVFFFIKKHPNPCLRSRSVESFTQRRILTKTYVQNMLIFHQHASFGHNSSLGWALIWCCSRLKPTSLPDLLNVPGSSIQLLNHGFQSTLNFWGVWDYLGPYSGGILEVFGVVVRRF